MDLSDAETVEKYLHSLNTSGELVAFASDIAGYTGDYSDAQLNRLFREMDKKELIFGDIFS